MNAGTVPPIGISGNTMLHLVVGQLSTGVERLEKIERLERNDEPAITAAIDVDEPRTRDLIEVALSRLNLAPEVDAQAAGSSCTVAGQTHLYVWWLAPMLEGIAA